MKKEDICLKVAFLKCFYLIKKINKIFNLFEKKINKNFSFYVYISIFLRKKIKKFNKIEINCLLKTFLFEKK